MPFRLTHMQSKPFGPKLLVIGIARCYAAANDGGSRGSECSGLSRVGCRGLLSHIPGLSSALMLVPEARAQCGSAACWDLCGGRPEKDRPYRDRTTASCTIQHRLIVVRIHIVASW